MLISCNKLKQHIKDSEKIDWLNIWDTFTIRTAEVESVTSKGSDMKDVVVVEITSCEKHPEKDKYSVLKVTDGKEEYSILCGAPNCKLGMKAALVKVGGMVSGFEITEKKIAGVLSQGMLCAMDELGIGSDHEGILELPEDYKIGKDLKKYLPIEDIIVEIDNKSLTNRPDLWGHYGIAREISAITGHELLPLELEEKFPTKLEDLKIKIKNKDLCSRFSGLKIDNIETNKTPLDMQIFLHYTGMRSISLLVDLSNYLMLELGQPNHAYNSAKIKEIIVDNAKDDTIFTTLDSIDRKLTKDNLMIYNEKEYIGIAGVMGGLDSEVEEDTTSIIIEAASFDATSVRKTATTLGLRTEASARFEKSLDPNMTVMCIKRFAKLLKDINPNIKYASKLTDINPKPIEEKEVILTKTKLSKYLGFEMEVHEVEKILTNLEFKVKTLKNHYTVTIPSFRATKDISIEEDIIEEISRMYGYENLTISPLKLDLTFTEHERVYDTEYEVKRFLATKYDLSEVHTYLWYKTLYLKNLDIEKNNITLLSKTDDNTLRDDLSLSLLELAGENCKNYNNFGIFEIGTTIQNDKNKRNLSILLVDNEKNIKTNYLKAKDIIFKIFKTFKNIKIEFIKSETFNYYDNSLTYNISYNNIILGNIKVFNKKVSNIIMKKKSFIAIDIDFDTYYNLEKELLLHKEISKYPKVTLDYTIIAPKALKYYGIDQIIKSFTSPIINDYKLMGIYEEEDNIKYTIRYTVGSYEKTLSTEELNDFKEKFINHIKNNNLTIIE